MATKLELAESLTVAQLRELAAEQDVNLSGLSSKDDIADAVAAGVAKADLEAYAEGGDDDVTDEGTSGGSETTAQERQRVEEEAPTAVGGEERIIRANPETPTIQQIEASGQVGLVPEPIKVTVGDEEVELDAGDAAQAQQRAASKVESEGAEAHSDPTYSNPVFASTEAQEAAAKENAEE